MEIKLANVSDAPIIHELMIKAFSKYKDVVPPSSALEETVESVTTALMEQEMGAIAYVEEQPVGMVRFTISEDELYFFRLSVIPEKQGQGIAKKLVNYLEKYAKNKGIPTLKCKVRMMLPKNIHLYHSIEFRVSGEEIVHKPNGLELKVVTMMKWI